jgi:hypothetical protein
VNPPCFGVLPHELSQVGCFDCSGKFQLKTVLGKAFDLISRSKAFSRVEEKSKMSNNNRVVV